MAKPRAVAHAVAAKKRLPSLLMSNNNRKSLPNNNVAKPKPEPPPLQMVNTDQQRQDKISDLTDPQEQLRLQQQPPIPHVDSAQQSTASSLTQPSALLSKLNTNNKQQQQHTEAAILHDAQERAKHVPLHSKLIFPQSPSTKTMEEQQSPSPEKRQRSKQRPDPADTASVIFPTQKSVGSSTAARNKLGFHAVKALLTRAVQGGSPTKRRQQRPSPPIPGIPVVVANTVATDQQSRSSSRDEPALEPPEEAATPVVAVPSPQQQRLPPPPRPRPEPSPRKNVAAAPQRAASPELLHRSDSPELRDERQYHHQHYPRGMDPDASVTSRGVVAEDPPVVVVVAGSDPPPPPVNVMGIPVDSDAVLQRMEQDDELQQQQVWKPSTTAARMTTKASTNPFDSTSSSSPRESTPRKGRRERVTTNPFDETSSDTSSEDGADDDPFQAIIAPAAADSGKVPPPIAAGPEDDEEEGIPVPSTTNHKKSPSKQKQQHRSTKRSKRLVGPLVERFEARANATNNNSSKPPNATAKKKQSSKFKKMPNEIDVSDGSLISDLDQSLRHFPLKVVDPADIKPDLVSTLEGAEEDAALNTITTDEEDEENQQRIAIEVGPPPPPPGNDALADSITNTTLLNGTPADIAMEVLSETCAMSPFSRLLEQDRKNRLSSLAIVAPHTGGQQLADTTPRISNEANTSQRRKQIAKEDGSDTHTGTLLPSSRGRESFSVLDQQRHETFFPHGTVSTMAHHGPDPDGDNGDDQPLTISPAETDHLDRYSVGDAKTTKSLFQRILGFGTKVHHMSPKARKQLGMKLDEMRDDVKTILDKSIEKAELENKQQNGVELEYPESLRQLDLSLRRHFRELGMNSILSMQTLLDDSEVDEPPTKQLTSVFKKLRESRGSPTVSDHIDPETASDIIKQMNDFSTSVKEAAKRSKAQAEDQGASRPLWTQELVDLTGISTYEALEDEEAVWLFDVNRDAPISELESIMEFAARRLGLPADGDKVTEILSPFAALRQEGKQEKKSFGSVNRSEENPPTVPHSFSERSGKHDDEYTVDIEKDNQQVQTGHQLDGREEKKHQDNDHESEVSSTDDLSVILKKIQRDVNTDKPKQEKQQSKPTRSTNSERRDFLDLIFEATETWLCGSKPNDVGGSSPMKNGSASNTWDDQEVLRTVSGHRTETESFESRSYSYLRGPKVPPPSTRSSGTDVDPFDGLESPARRSRSDGNQLASTVQGNESKDEGDTETVKNESSAPAIKPPEIDGSEFAPAATKAVNDHVVEPHDRRKAMDAPQTSTACSDFPVVDTDKPEDRHSLDDTSDVGVMPNDKGKLRGPKPEQFLTAIVPRMTDVAEDARQRPPLPERMERKLTMRSTPRSLLSSRGKAASRRHGWAATTSSENETSCVEQSSNLSPSKLFQSNDSIKQDHTSEHHISSKSEQDHNEADQLFRQSIPTLRTRPKPDFEVCDLMVDHGSIDLPPPPPAPESPLPPTPQAHLPSSKSSASDCSNFRSAINDKTEQTNPSEVREDVITNHATTLHLPEQLSVDQSDCASVSTTSESARRVVQAYLDSVEDSLSKMTPEGAHNESSAANEQKVERYSGKNDCEGSNLTTRAEGEEIARGFSNHDATSKPQRHQESEEHCPASQVVSTEKYDEFAPFLGTVVEQVSLLEKGSSDETDRSDEAESTDKQARDGRADDTENSYDEVLSSSENVDDHAEYVEPLSSTENVDRTTMGDQTQNVEYVVEPQSSTDRADTTSEEKHSEQVQIMNERLPAEGFVIDAESYLTAVPQKLEDCLQGTRRDVDEQESPAIIEKSFSTPDSEKGFITGSDSDKPSIVEIPNLQNSTQSRHTVNDQIPPYEEPTTRSHSLKFDSIESRRQFYDQSAQKYQHQKDASSSDTNDQQGINHTSSSSPSSSDASVIRLDKPKSPIKGADRTTNEDGSVIDLAATKSAEGMNPETPIILDDFEPDMPQLNTSPESTDYPQISHGTPLVPALDVTENDIAFSLSPSTAASSPQKLLQGRSKRNDRSNFEEEEPARDGLNPTKNDSPSSSFAGLAVVDEATETIPVEISIKSHETSIQPDTDGERESSIKQTSSAPSHDLAPVLERSVLEKTLVMLDEEFSEAGESSASLLLALTRSGETESQVDDESENLSPKQRDAIVNPGSREHRSSADKARALLLKRRSPEFQARALQKESPSPKKALSPLRRALMKHRDRRISRETDSTESVTNTPQIATSRSFDSASPKSSVAKISPLRASLEKRLKMRNKLISGTPGASVEPLDAEALYSRYSGVEKSVGVIDVTDLSARDLLSRQDDDASSPSTMLNTSANASFFPDSEDLPGTTIQTTKVISNVVERLNIDQSDSDDETIRSSNTERKMGDMTSWEAKSTGSTTTMESIRDGLPKTRRVLDSVMDKLRLQEEKRESDADSTDMDDLFQRYDNIVKHLVVLDDERLARAQAKQMASIVHAADSAVLDDGKMSSSVRRPKSPIRALSEIASRIRKKSVSPRSFQFRREKKVSSADKVMAARFEERPEIVRSVSFGSASIHNRSSASVSSDGTHPSSHARHLRKQLEVALETSAQIRSSHAQLCEDLSSAQSRMQHRRINNSIRGGSHSAPTSPYVVHDHPGSPFSGNTNRTKSFYHRHCAPSSPTYDSKTVSVADSSNSSQPQHRHDYTFPKVILAPSSTTDDDDTDDDEEEEIKNRHLESIRSGLRNSPRNSTTTSPRNTNSSPRNFSNSPRRRRRRQ